MPEAFPWPVSLGIAGLCLSGLIWTLIWVVKKVGTGEWVPKPTVERAIQDKVDMLEAERLAKEEWRSAAEASEQGRIEALDIARSAIESNKLVDYFFNEMLPKVPQKGDTGSGGES